MGIRIIDDLLLLITLQGDLLTNGIAPPVLELNLRIYWLGVRSYSGVTDTGM